jgi:hypothetical protein
MRKGIIKSNILKKDLGLMANNHAYEVKMKKPNLGDHVSVDEDTRS